MNANELTAKVASLVKAKKLLDQDSKVSIAALKDETIALAIRWESFEALSKASLFDRNDAYSNGHHDIFDEEISLYDDFSIDRRSSRDYVEFYQDLLDHYKSELTGSDEEVKTARLANFEEWKEAVLQDGYSSFTYDW